MVSGPVLSKGNYAVSWGNTNWRQEALAGRPYLQSAFGHRMLIRMAYVTDGLSNTVFLGEVLKAGKHDVRGVIWSRIPGGGSFMTRFAPNQFNDALDLKSGADQLNAALFCESEPVLCLPCASIDSDHRAFAGARSRHPGGIMALFGDGSVRFQKDSVAHPVWIGLNSIAGGEITSADSY